MTSSKEINPITGAEIKVVDLMAMFKRTLSMDFVGDAHIFIVLGASVSFTSEEY